MRKAVKKDVAKAAKTEKKKVVRKKRKVGARKAARKSAKKKVVRKRRKVAKIAKVAKKRGRPPLKKKPGRKPGRKPRAKVGRKPKAAAELITLPINNQTDVDFWSNIVAYMNKNKGRSFIIQLDGTSFSLGVQ